MVINTLERLNESVELSNGERTLQIGQTISSLRSMGNTSSDKARSSIMLLAATCSFDEGAGVAGGAIGFEFVT